MTESTAGLLSTAHAEATVSPWEQALPGRSDGGGPHAAAHEERVAEHFATVRASFARFIMLWSIVVNFAWGVTDPWVLGDIPGALDGMLAMRICVLVGALVVLAVLRGQRTLRGPRLLLCCAIWLVELGAVAASVAVIGDLSKPWFHGLYLLVLATMVLPLPLLGRAVFASLVGATLFAGFILARPSSLQSEYLGYAIGFMTFTVGGAIAFGHQFQRINRRAFEQQLEVERAAAIVARQRDTLRREVERRTLELRHLAEHLDKGGEEMRRRIARELHDELGQSVSALRLSLGATRRRFAKAPAAIGANLEELDELVRRVADGTRDAITHLRPRILDDRGLVEAAQWLVRATARHSELDVSLTTQGDLSAVETPAEADTEEREAGPVSTAAFRILQEALTNVVRHAGAQRVDIALEGHDGTLGLLVRDDGVGLPEEGPGPSQMGLLTMRERAEALGGSLTVRSGPGGGTELRCQLPLASSGAAA